MNFENTLLLIAIICLVLMVIIFIILLILEYHSFHKYCRTLIQERDYYQELFEDKQSVIKIFTKYIDLHKPNSFGTYYYEDCDDYEKMKINEVIKL